MAEMNSGLDEMAEAIRDTTRRFALDHIEPWPFSIERETDEQAIF